MAQLSAESEPVTAAPAAGVTGTPLGVFALAITLFVLSLINAGFLKDPSNSIVIGLAIFLGGVVLLVAGTWEFRAGNTFTGTVFTSYSALWLSFGFILLPGTGIFAALAKENMVYPALGLSSGMDYLHSPADDLCPEDQCGAPHHLRCIVADLPLVGDCIPGWWINFLSNSRWLPRHPCEFPRMVPRPGGLLPYINPRISLPVGPLS